MYFSFSRTQTYRVCFKNVPIFQFLTCICLVDKIFRRNLKSNFLPFVKILPWYREKYYRRLLNESLDKRHSELKILQTQHENLKKDLVSKTTWVKI